MFDKCLAICDKLSILTLLTYALRHNGDIVRRHTLDHRFLDGERF